MSTQYARDGSSGMAVASLVLGILALVGSCLLSLLMAPIALIGIVLAIIVLAGKRPGKGMAIGGLVCSALSLLLGLAVAAVMLPALGKARQEARMIKSEVQLRNIGQALYIYAQGNKDQLPPAGADWQAILLKEGSVTPPLLVSPNAEEGQVSYIYVPGVDVVRDDPATTILAYENPEVRSRLHPVVFLSMQTTRMSREEIEAALDRQAKARRTRPAQNPLGQQPNQDPG